MRRKIYLLFAICYLLFLTGCGTSRAVRKQTEKQSTIIANLNATIEQLNFRLKELTRAKSNLLEIKLELEDKLKKELSGGDLKVQLQKRGLIITLNNNILFDSGQTFIKPQAKKGLNKIAEIINLSCPNNLISVEGHTDNRPIKYSEKYPSNWELSAARATEVVRYLIKQGISPQQLSAVGYGEYYPIVLNNSPQGRANNRRVEIIISTQNQPVTGLPVEQEEREEK